MSLIAVIVILVLAYIVYTMMQSYRGMERELREIRLRCMGTTQSKYETQDPVSTLRNRLTEGLQVLSNASK